MMKLLTYDPDERPSAKVALRHPYFKDIREIDKRLRKHKAGSAGAEDVDDAESQAAALLHGTSIGGLGGRQKESTPPPMDSSKLPPLPQGGGSLPALGHKGKGASMAAGNASVIQNSSGSRAPVALPKVRDEAKSLPKLVSLGSKK